MTNTRMKSEKSRPKVELVKKVLVVEDNEGWCKYWRSMLENKVLLILAHSIEDAEDQFVANPDIAAIVMDGAVPGDELNTLPLVRKFRQTFTGPMIAISTIEIYREKLVRVGCSHKCGKDSVPAKVLEVLGL